MNNSKSKYVIVLMTLLVAVSGFYMYWAYSTSGECMANPFVYGAKEMSEKYEGSTVCSCSILNKEDYLKSIKFSFTDTGFNQKEDTL